VLKTTCHPGGALQFTFDPVLGHVRTIQGSETVTLKAGDTVFSERETSLRLEFLNKDTLPDRDLDHLKRLAEERALQGVSESLLSKGPSARTKLLAHKQELGDATLESLLAELAREEKSTEANKDQTPLYRKIKALICVQPETSRRWGALVSRAAPNSLAMRLVTGALATAGHEQAQAALSSVLQARVNEELVALYLIPTLAMVDAPSELTEATLRELALHAPGPRIVASAQLALGTMARSLKEDHPDRAGKIVTWAVRELEAGASEDTRRHFLLVLGNAGAPGALPAIQKFLGDPDAAVRAAAVGALRFIDSDQAEALITRALGSDSEPDVRAEAVRVFAYRSVTQPAFQAIVGALRADESASVRLAALNLLWQCRQMFSQVGALVENVARNDPDDAIRKRAGELLQDK
jgi:hypothetical protein